MKKALSLLLAIVMVIGMVPMTVFANTNSSELENLALTEGTTAWATDAFTDAIIEPSEVDAELRAELAINGNYDDEAVPGAGHNRWNLIVKLPESVENVNTIKVNGSKIAGQMPPNYSVLVSEDGENWILVDKVTTKTEPVANDYVLTAQTVVTRFSSKTVQYVMFRDDTKVNFMRISEIEIYADENYVHEDNGNLALFSNVKLLTPDGERELNYVGYESSQKNHPSNATDGNVATGTVAAGNYQWQAQLDLGEIKQDINMAKITFSDLEDGTPLVFTISASKDGVTWKKVAEKSFPSVAEREQEVTLMFPDINARYIRVCDGLAEEYNSAGDRIQMCIAEVELYATPPVNYALNKPVKVYRTDNLETELTFASNAIGKLTDITNGDKTSHVYPGRVYSLFTYEIDLGADYEGVNKVVTSFVKDGNHGVPKNYGVAVKNSADAEWTLVSAHNPAANDKDISTIDHTFNPRTVRYIRVQSFSEENTAGAQRAMFLSEVEAYADTGVPVNHAYQKPVKLLRSENMTELTPPAGIETVTDGLYNNYYYGSNSIWSLHAYEVDLGEEIEDIDTVVASFIHDSGHGVPKDYEILVAGEDKIWEKVATVTDAQNPEGISRLKYQFPDKAVRYILVKGTSEVSGRAMYIAEIEVYADSKTDVRNLALAKGTVAYAVRNDGTVIEPREDGLDADMLASKAIDGDLSNEAVPGAGYEHGWDLVIELPKPVENVNTVHYHGSRVYNQTPPNYSVWTSPDGTNWELATEVDEKPYTSISSTYGLGARDKYIVFPNRTVKAVKFMDDTNCNFMRVGELEIYADSNIPFDAKSSISSGQTGVSVAGKIEFNFNRPIPEDLEVTYADANGNPVVFTQIKDGVKLTVKPKNILAVGTRYVVTVSSAQADYTKKIIFTTETQISEMTITTTSSSTYMSDRDNAIYPAFVDNLHYQSWTMDSGMDYFQMKTTGAVGDVTWAIESGSLPTGLSLTKDGKIVGTPTEEGAFNFTVKVTDFAGRSITKALDMVAKPFRAKWHYDAKFGMMTQWGPYNHPAVTLASHQDGTNTIADWEERASNFDPQGWAADMKAMGAEYFNFTVMGGDNIRLWPSTTPTQYELKTQRNYAKELIDACHAQGIKFIAYLPGGGGWSGIFDRSTIDGSISTMHMGIMEELINMGVDGFWIDSSGSIGNIDNFNWERIIPMVRYLNPDVIVGSNPVGTQNGYISNYPYTDFVINEGHYCEDVVDRPVARWSNTTKKMSVDMTALHQGQWAYIDTTNQTPITGTMNSAQHIITNISNNWANGVTYTAATPAPTDGSSFMDAEARVQMTQVGEWVNANKESAPFDVNRGDKNIAQVDPTAISQTAFKQVGNTSIVKEVRQGDTGWYDSYAGIKFIASTTPITVTRLGRYVLEGNDQVHRLRLVELGPEYTIYHVLREVELDLSTATVDKDGFAYADINPITLNPGTIYFLMSTEDTTDTFAVPNFDALTSNYKANIFGQAWTDISGTRVTSETFEGDYYWPYMTDKEEVKNGGLVNFKAVVGTQETSTNLALGGIATMTDNAGNSVTPSSHRNPAQLAIDGRTDTSTLAGDGAWNWTLCVDLGEVKAGVNRVDVKFKGEHIPVQYEIWTSENGVDYTKQASSIFNLSNVSKTFTAVNARYVKFVTTKVKGNNIGSIITELEVYSNITYASAPTSITLQKGSTNPVSTVRNVAIPTPDCTDTSGSVTEWMKDAADTIKFTVVDAQGATSTIKINGKAYTSGNDYKVTEAGTLQVVVTTAQSGKATTTRMFDIDVAEPTAPEPEVIGSEVYTIADGFIRKIEVGTTVNGLLENVTPAGGDIKVYKSDTAATAMRETVAVGTGNVVKLFDADGNVVDSLTVVILGDVSGDGKINATDLISLVAYIGGSREYTEAQTIAANLMQPVRPTINAQDLGYLKDAINGTKTITQK